MPWNLRFGAIGSALALTLAGCGGDHDRQPGSAELNLVTAQLDAQLNEPVRQLRRTLAGANADQRIYPSELALTGPDETMPVDWWMYRAGLIELAGADSYGQEYFKLTPKGEAIVREDSPSWFASHLKDAPRADCSGGSGWASCRVVGVAEVQLTAEGEALASGAKVEPQSFQAQLQYGPGGWRVGELTAGHDPRITVRLAVFGDDAAVRKARYAWALEVNRKVR